MEFAIMDFIQNNLRNPIMDQLMVILTILGESGRIWIVFALVLVFTKRYRKYGILMFCSLAVTFLLGELFLKNIVCRVRPCDIVDSIEMLVSRPRTYSFPSGHSASSFTSAWILLKLNKKLGIAALCFAGLIAFSRVYLYVHFPTDILAGALLGILCAQAVWLFYKKKIQPSADSKAKI